METIGNIKIKSPLDHNPSFWIAEIPLDKDSVMTCAVHIETGDALMEYYRGENYVLGSTERSYSRVYQDEKKIPLKYIGKYRLLKSILADYRKK